MNKKEVHIETTEKNELYKYYNDILNKDSSTIRTINDVCTPIECVCEMMQQIPEELWKLQNLSILDPCCGNGNFHAVIYNILRDHGKTHQEIVSNILYFNDTNQDRLKNVRLIFSNETNITCDDYLKEESTVGGGALLDLIVANPPYAKLMADGKRASKNHNMIGAFLKKSLNLLKSGGYLAFITPDNWMSYADRNDLVDLLTSHRIIYLNIHTAKKYFPKIGSSFTWYIVQKNHSITDGVNDDIITTTIEGIWNKRHYITTIPRTHRFHFIPLLYDPFVQSILSKTLDLGVESPRFQIQTSSDLHRYTKRDLISINQDEAHPYRLIHTPKQTVWASRPHKYQEGYKVFISLTDKYSVFIDQDCGMTQSIAFIRCHYKNDTEIIKQILEHPLYVFLNNICRWGNFNNIRILQNFPIPSDPENIYGSFGITEEEQRHIESNL